MKKLLVICPTARDYRELALLNNEYQIIFHGYDERQFEQLAKDILSGRRRVEDELSLIIKKCEGLELKGIMSSDDCGVALASIVADRLGLVGPRPELLIRSQHKYHARLDQRRYVPSATPEFALIDPDISLAEQVVLPFPFFIKPVRSNFSQGAQLVHNMHELEQAIAFTNHGHPETVFFARLFEQYAGITTHANCWLAEEYVSGVQVTVEGWVDDRAVFFTGIVDSLMFPGTISFSRFSYPTSLPGYVQERMKHIARTYIQSIGLDKSFFNIELIYDPVRDRIVIVEINLRMASQFSDLFEKVDGYNTYQSLIDLATKKQVTITQGGGPHEVAASCVLRTFKDKNVAQVPSDSSREALLKKHPDMRFELCAKKGKKLSDVLQDGKSYRYGLVHLGAHNWKQLDDYFDECKKILDFVFEAL